VRRTAYLVLVANEDGLFEAEGGLPSEDLHCDQVAVSHQLRMNNLRSGVLTFLPRSCPSTPLTTKHSTTKVAHLGVELL
jgi:hypothetical protein